jgi:phenylacetate-coenzyme A ligase PaaK-like adenylate-forming protein
VTPDAFTPFAPLRARMQSELLRRLPEQIARLGWSAAQIAAHQREALRALLAHARAHSPFHARRLRDVDAARIELEELAALPVMTKDELMEAFDDALTDRRISRPLAEQALAATKDEPQPLFGEFVCLSSGGSSGRRGVFVQDFEAVAAFLCSVNRGAMKRMLAAGHPPPPGGLTVGMVAANSAVHATGAGPAWTAGGPMRLVAVPVTLPLAEIVERLNALQPAILYGYPSMLARLAHEQREGRLRIAPESVTCTSESLLPEWRAAIRSAFDAPIVDTFGSTEGLVGVSEPDALPICFNSDVCIVELVDAGGRPVPPGAPSDRILVTNLANRVQPLIRYEIRDRFVRHPDAAEHGHLRATVAGRADDVLRFGTVDVHPLVIRAVLVKTPAVSDYQVRQTARGVELCALAYEPLDLERLRGELVEALAAAGLPGAEVIARRVPSLERHADTGKLRRVIPA